jgi:hypothetical protein
MNKITCGIHAPSTKHIEVYIFTGHTQLYFICTVLGTSTDGADDVMHDLAHTAQPCLHAKLAVIRIIRTDAWSAIHLV